MKRQRLEKGLVQVYTGDGKGKTSAAFGLALRAIGRGLKVYIVQFIKGGFDYGEIHGVEQLPCLELRAFGSGRFIMEEPPKKEDVDLARRALKMAESIVRNGEYDVVILDEINVAMSLKLIPVADVVNLAACRPEHVELILTGRQAPSEIIAMADLVTEMKEIKHPFKKGVPPRRGIEY
jgi:cob(I)alamin adenosyltransferase